MGKCMKRGALLRESMKRENVQLWAQKHEYRSLGNRHHITRHTLTMAATFTLLRLLYFCPAPHIWTNYAEVWLTTICRDTKEKKLDW